MKLFSFLFRYSQRMVTIAIVTGIIAGGSSAALVAFINANLNNSRSPSGMTVWLMTALVAAVFISGLASRLILNRLSRRAVFDMRMRLCREVLAVPLRRLEEIGSHQILAALTEDVAHISAAIINIPLFFINLMLSLACFVYLGSLSLLVFFFLSLFLVMAILSMEVLDRRAMRFHEMARREWDRLFKYFRALVDGSKELKLHQLRREAFLSQLLESTTKSHLRNWLSGRDFESASASWNQSLFFIFIVLILFGLPHLSEINRQTLASYAVTFLYMAGPVAQVVSLIPIFNNATVSLRKIEELGLSLASSGENVSAGPVERAAMLSWEQLEMSGVTHTYYRERDHRSFTLGPIDLTFYPGELVFLVGDNGSGKTTLAKLLTGLYTPESGEIRMNGEPITDLNLEGYRQYFSMIFSDPYLFEQLLGLDTPNLDSKAREYITRLQLDHKVTVKDGTLSTVELSAGQRKRLALLTAYLEDRPIYVFDEWAADQDPVFKDFFYYHLLPELHLKGKTILVISHDDRFYSAASRLIKLENGRVESDAHNRTNGPSGLHVPKSMIGR
jgi:putative pyoverdin transport system ATP-binding/permease protein